MNREEKKKPPMPPEIKKLVAEWEELTERHEAAIAAKDYTSARETGRAITSFVNRHQDDLKIPAAEIAELNRLEKEVEASYQESLKAEKTAKESARRARRAEDEYYRALLEQPPRGKGYTGH